MSATSTPTTTPLPATTVKEEDATSSSISTDLQSKTSDKTSSATPQQNVKHRDTPIQSPVKCEPTSSRATPTPVAPSAKTENESKAPYLISHPQKQLSPEKQPTASAHDPAKPPSSYPAKSAARSASPQPSSASLQASQSVPVSSNTLPKSSDNREFHATHMNHINTSNQRVNVDLNKDYKPVPSTNFSKSSPHSQYDKSKPFNKPTVNHSNTKIAANNNIKLTNNNVKPISANIKPTTSNIKPTNNNIRPIHSRPVHGPGNPSTIHTKFPAIAIKPKPSLAPGPQSGKSTFDLNARSTLKSEISFNINTSKKWVLPPRPRPGRKPIAHPSTTNGTSTPSVPSSSSSPSSSKATSPSVTSGPTGQHKLASATASPRKKVTRVTKKDADTVRAKTIQNGARKQIIENQISTSQNATNKPSSSTTTTEKHVASFSSNVIPQAVTSSSSPSAQANTPTKVPISSVQPSKLPNSSPSSTSSPAANPSFVAPTALSSAASTSTSASVPSLSHGTSPSISASASASVSASASPPPLPLSSSAGPGVRTKVKEHSSSLQTKPAIKFEQTDEPNPGSPVIATTSQQPSKLKQESRTRTALSSVASNSTTEKASQISTPFSPNTASATIGGSASHIAMPPAHSTSNTKANTNINTTNSKTKGNGKPASSQTPAMDLASKFANVDKPLVKYESAAPSSTTAKAGAIGDAAKSAAVKPNPKAGKKTVVQLQTTYLSKLKEQELIRNYIDIITNQIKELRFVQSGVITLDALNTNTKTFQAQPQDITSSYMGTDKTHLDNGHPPTPSTPHPESPPQKPQQVNAPPIASMSNSSEQLEKINNINDLNKFLAYLTKSSNIIHSVTKKFVNGNTGCSGDDKSIESNGNCASQGLTEQIDHYLDLRAQYKTAAKSQTSKATEKVKKEKSKPSKTSGDTKGNENAKTSEPSQTTSDINASSILLSPLNSLNSTPAPMNPIPANTSFTPSLLKPLNQNFFEFQDDLIDIDSEVLDNEPGEFYKQSSHAMNALDQLSIQDNEMSNNKQFVDNMVMGFDDGEMFQNFQSSGYDSSLFPILPQSDEDSIGNGNILNALQREEHKKSSDSNVKANSVDSPKISLTPDASKKPDIKKFNCGFCTNDTPCLCLDADATFNDFK